MTILPKRNKRRFESRDESVQQIQQTGGNATIETSTSSPLQIQVEPTRPHSVNLSHLQSTHHSGHSSLQATHSRYNQPNVYTLLQRAEAAHTKAPVPCTTENGKRRSTSGTSSSRQGLSTEETVSLANKKTKRAKMKQKHKYEGHTSKGSYDLSTKPKMGTVPATYIPTYQQSSSPSSSSHPQSRSALLPATTNVAALISPNLPGSATETPVTGAAAASPENHVNSEDEYQNAPSPSGCNSEDEYAPRNQYSEDLEKTFEHALKNELGMDIKQMEMDGSCLFRAIADQVYGDQDMHDLVRNNCIDYMAKNADHFSHYVTEDFTMYLQRKRQLGCHGNHVELQALSEMYNRPIEVYQYSLNPMNIFHSTHRSESVCPIRLTYHRNTHYNSLVDPNRPTIGVGLGLPGLRPRMVEQNLIADVKVRSENYQLEETMLNDKMRETDWEITDEAIQEHIARESYIQWLEDQKRARRAPACTITGPSCSSLQGESSTWEEKLSPSTTTTRAPTSTSAQSPNRTRSVAANDNVKTSPTSALDSQALPAAVLSSEKPSSSSSTADLPVLQSDSAAAAVSLEPFAIYNFNGDVEEEEAIARAIAESQQEYINQVIQKK